MSLNVLTHPHPATNPTSPLMLAGEWVPADARKINFNTLPKIPSAHGIVHDGHLLVAFAGAKQSVEVLKIKLSDLAVLQH